MKILIIMRYVKQLLAFAVSFIKTAKLRGVALDFVRNVFKKKSCGASLCKSETVLNGKDFYKDFGTVINRTLSAKQIELLKARHEFWKESCGASLYKSEKIILRASAIQYITSCLHRHTLRIY